MTGALDETALEELRKAAREGAQAAVKAASDEASGLAVSFNDILFGLSIAVVFGAVAANPTGLPSATWAQLIVAGWLIALSWFGYHRTRLQAPSPFKTFRSARFVQYMIDAVILATYFVLAQYAVQPGRRNHLTIRPQATTIFLIFVLYLVWDLLETSVTSGSTPEEVVNRKRARARAKVSAAFVGIMLVVGGSVWLSNPRTRNPVIFWCAVYFVAVFVYRVWQEWRETKA